MFPDRVAVGAFNTHVISATCLSVSLLFPGFYQLGLHGTIHLDEGISEDPSSLTVSLFLSCRLERETRRKKGDKEEERVNRNSHVCYLVC